MMLVPAITNLAHVHASPLMELDGVGTSGSNSGCSAFCMRSQLLTTSMGDDMIIVTLECGEGPSSGHPCDGITITDNTGLTFTKRLSFPASGDSGTLWEFYAVAASPLKSDNITVAADFCCRGGGMLVLGIHGANTSMVFDPNRSIPASNSYTRGDCIVGSGTCSASIQTDTVDFVIGTTAIDDAPPCGDGYPNGNVPGFTNIGSGPNSNFEVDYAITTTSQTNVEYACSDTDERDRPRRSIIGEWASIPRAYIDQWKRWFHYCQRRDGWDRDERQPLCDKRLDDFGGELRHSDKRYHSLFYNNQCCDFL